jgi:hypothetical protein
MLTRMILVVWGCMAILFVDLTEFCSLATATASIGGLGLSLPANPHPLRCIMNIIFHDNVEHKVLAENAPVALDKVALSCKLKQAVYYIMHSRLILLPWLSMNFATELSPIDIAITQFYQSFCTRA